MDSLDRECSDHSHCASTWWKTLVITIVCTLPESVLSAAQQPPAFGQLQIHPMLIHCGDFGGPAILILSTGESRHML